MVKKEKKEYSEDESDSKNEIKEKLLKKKRIEGLDEAGFSRVGRLDSAG
jgi:hypothetical protein